MIELKEEKEQVVLEVESQDINPKLEEVFVLGGSSNDYNDLVNKPKLNGQIIEGDIEEVDPTVPMWAKESAKPIYNADEVGAVDSSDIVTLEEIDSWFKNV